jgi:hypothetical protein
MGSAQVDPVITGQLKVDIADNKAKFFWRGTATDTLSNDPQRTPRKSKRP